jgi:hypothetical protein
MKKFAAFDIDGTIFGSGLYREIVYELLSKDRFHQKLSKNSQILKLIGAKERAIMLLKIMNKLWLKQ